MPTVGRLESALATLTAAKVPAVSAVVVRDGEIAESASAGVADIREGRPATADTAYLWFSMTKIVTATAVMQLAEQEALGLDDPVERFVPDFPKPRSGWPPVRIRDLMSHSSGLANPVPVRWVHPAESPGPDPHEFALARLRRHSRLRRPAGSRAVYSNLGYLALGEVIAAASGGTFEGYVTDRILKPLSMSRTAFAFDRLDGDVATGYQPHLSPMTPLFRLLLPAGIMGDRAGRFIAFRRFCVDGPAYGGLIGPPRDAARFMAAHLSGGGFAGVRLLQPQSVAAMQTIQARGRAIEVGFGWFRRGRARSSLPPYLEHLGAGGGFWNMMRIYPSLAVGVVAMGNATRWDHEAVAGAVLPRGPGDIG